MVDNVSLISQQQHPEEQFLFYSCSGPERLNLKEVKERLSFGVCERYNQDCLIYHHGRNQMIFIFKYGTAVFFNLPPEDRNHFLSIIGIAPFDRSTTSAPNDTTEDDFTLKVRPGPIEVGFNAISVARLDLLCLQIVAQSIALSSALEVIEHEVELFMRESEQLTGFLKRRGMANRRRGTLLMFIGKCLSARHRIINQLALFSEPDATWEREDLHHTYKKLFAVFDITERMDKIDKMMRLSGEVTSLLLEILNTRRAEILELIIIALILVEVVKAFYQ